MDKIPKSNWRLKQMGLRGDDMFLNVERKHVVLLIVCAVMMIASLIAHHFVVGSAEAAYNNVNAQVASLQSKIDVIQAAQNTQSQQSANRPVGINTSRFATDAQVFDSFLEELSAWDTYKGYVDLRAKLMSTYGMDEKGEFLTSILPEIAREGNAIDSKNFRVSFSNPNVVIAGSSGDRYDYVAFVDMVHTQEKDKISTIPVVMSFSVDASGAISNIDGTVLAADK